MQAAPTDTFYTKFEFELDNYVESIEDEIYFKPGVYFEENKNVFVSEKRSFPVEFGYCWKDIETSYFTFPEGYVVSEIPKEIIIENEYVKYERIALVTNQSPLTIGFSRQFEIKKLEVPVKDYQLIKNDFSKIVDADQEVIIVKHVEQ